MLLATYYLLFTTYYLLLTTYYLLLATYHPLLTTYYLILNTYSICTQGRLQLAQGRALSERDIKREDLRRAHCGAVPVQDARAPFRDGPPPRCGHLHHELNTRAVGGSPLPLQHAQRTPSSPIRPSHTYSLTSVTGAHVYPHWRRREHLGF